MYEKELLPICISIGISPDEFWRLNPRKLKPYYEAVKINEEKTDAHMWRMGYYVCEAVGVAVYNNLKGKGRKSLDYLKEPLSATAREVRGELTEEEKMKRVNAIFNSLQIMKINYELEHKKDAVAE